MRLFELLKTEQKHVRLTDSPEYAFFMTHRHLFVDHNVFLDLYNLEDDFALIKANIVLKSIINKETIEAKLQELKETSIRVNGRFKHHEMREAISTHKWDLPFFMDKDLPCYIPIFNRAMNYIYAKEPDKLCDFPYQKLQTEFANSIINPFETYNFALYDSYFTRLIKLGQDATSMAFYHLDFRKLYVVNRQGGLDIAIPVFDRFIDREDEEGIVDRLLPVVNCFFANDREGMVAALLNGRLVSQQLVDRYYGHLANVEKKRYKL